jgi:hypothetical protein
MLGILSNIARASRMWAMSRGHINPAGRDPRLPRVIAANSQPWQDGAPAVFMASMRAAFLVLAGGIMILTFIFIIWLAVVVAWFWCVR